VNLLVFRKVVGTLCGSARNWNKREPTWNKQEKTIAQRYEKKDRAYVCTSFDSLSLGMYLVHGEICRNDIGRLRTAM